MRCHLNVIVVLGLALLLPVAGCGPSPAAKAVQNKGEKNAKTKTPKKAAAPEPPKEEKIDPNAFAGVDEALAAIVTATAENKQSDINKAQLWLSQRGPSIHPQLAAKVRDANAHLAARITSARVLAMAGEVASPVLMEITAEGYKPDQLRQNGAQLLGTVKPSTKAIIDRLAALIQEKDGRIRVAALQAMQKIGPDVKKLRPDLVQKLKDTYNSTTEDETVRTQALATLKKVEPHQGFSGLGKIEK